MRSFFLRIKAKRGHQIAAVATACKLAVIIWHMLEKQEEYTWKRPSLVAYKRRSLELQAGLPARRGGRKRGPSHAYRVLYHRQLSSKNVTHSNYEDAQQLLDLLDQSGNPAYKVVVHLRKLWESVID